MELINKLFDERFYSVTAVKWDNKWMGVKGDLSPLIHEYFNTYARGQIAMIDSYGRKIILTHTKYGHVIINERFFGGAGGVFDAYIPDEFKGGALDSPLTLDVLKKTLGIDCDNIGVRVKTNRDFNVEVIKASKGDVPVWTF